MSTDEIDDCWAQQPNVQATPSEPSLQVQTLEYITPLGDQFGVAAPKIVPDALHDFLFGQPEPTEAELAEAGGDPAKVPSLRTYAILDAAKVTNLPEMLDASGLEHRCLFKGDAYDELKNVAPWIVRLEEGSTFTRNLFTRSDAPWHIWDAEPGIYLRSHDTLDDVRKHFRKFTRVQDEAGAWFYLRLYDPYIMQAFLQGAPEFADRILSRPFPWDDLTVVTCFADRVKTFRAAQKRSKEQRMIRLGSDEKAVLRHLTFEARADQLMVKLDKSSGVAMPTEPEVREAHKATIVGALHKMYGYGFQQPMQQDRWAIWEIFYSAGFERADPYLRQICDTKDRPSGERFALFKRRVEEIYG